jgi:hypothetical protein
LEFVALGSYDSFDAPGNARQDLVITYHRFEPRLLYRGDGSEFGVALTVGWDESGIGTEFLIRASRVAPRAWYEQRLGSRSRLRLSADVQGIWGGPVGPVGGDLADQLAITSIGTGRRSVISGQAELVLRPWTLLELQLGGRVDAWLRGEGSAWALDPRLRAILHISDTFAVHVAGGTVHQPAVPYLPLPGLPDFASTRVLQRALQAEAGFGWDTPLELRVELQLFVHRYRNLSFTDRVFLEGAYNEACMVIDCMGAGAPPARVGGYSYGAEFFLRRPFTQALSGFVSYTLAWSTVDRVSGLHYTPTWDVRHVANLVLQWQIGAGFSVGLRASIRSGKTDGLFYVGERLNLARYEQRLPGFARLDLQVGYAWRTHWGRMRVGLEWMNVTLAQESTRMDCDGPGNCRVNYLPALFFPNLSLRGEH